MSRKTLALVGFAVRWAVFMVLSIPPLCFIWYPLTWAFYAIAYRQDAPSLPVYQKFSRSAPFFRYGVLVAEQNITFRSPRSEDNTDALEAKALHLLEKVAREIPRLTSRLTQPQIRLVTISDVSLQPEPYEKSFIEYSTETYFKTQVSILFGVTGAYDQVSAHWWLLIRSRISLWKAICAGLIAPFTVLYWGARQLQGLYSIKAALASDIEHDYDALDVQSWLGTFQTHVFSDLIQQMKAAGFDIDLDKQAIHFHQPLSLGKTSSLQYGTLLNSPARERIESSHEAAPEKQTQPFIDATQPSREAFEKRLSAETFTPQLTVQAFMPEIASIAMDDTVEVPQLIIEPTPTGELEEVMPVHLSELQHMLRYHVESQPDDEQHTARAVINELIVELETGDEISIKVLTDLLGELRATLGETALRDTLEMLTDPTGQFNDIVQEITGDMLANLGDEMALKAKKRELNETLIEYANTLEVLKRPLARIVIFSLMHALDHAETRSYESVFKEIDQHLGAEAYAYMLQIIEAEENHFPAAAQSQAKKALEIQLKKQDLRSGLMNRTGSLEPLRKEQAIESIDRLIEALEDPEITDYKALFREIGLRLGRPAYESILRKLATNESYFPIAQSDAKRDLDLYERAQQRSVN